jgi:hypothetical protein
LNQYQRECAGLAEDWSRLRALVEAFPKEGANKAQLEGEFIALRSRLSCDYTVLTRWRKGGYGLTAGVHKMLASTTTLSDAASNATHPESRFNRTWRDVHSSLTQIATVLQGAQARVQAGKPATLPPDLLEDDSRPPFPIWKVLKITGILVAVVLLAAGAYVLRNFFGFGAPGAGEGIVVDASMSDEDKIRSVLTIMNEAFIQDDVDMFMTLIADDFEDEEGNSKTALRVALQAYHEQGDFGSVRADWSNMELLEKDGYIYARPVVITTVDDEFAIYLGFKPYRGKLLIATATST